jgi:hypothetical protein
MIEYRAGSVRRAMAGRVTRMSKCRDFQAGHQQLQHFARSRARAIRALSTWPEGRGHGGVAPADVTLPVVIEAVKKAGAPSLS